jgi:hypothetical protein
MIRTREEPQPDPEAWAAFINLFFDFLKENMRWQPFQGRFIEIFRKFALASIPLLIAFLLSRGVSANVVLMPKK